MTDMTAKALATQLILLNSNWGMSSLHLEWTRSLPPPFFFLLRVSFKHHKSREATSQVLWLLTSCLSREPHAQCPSRADQLCCTLWELWSTTVRWSSALPPKRCCELFARSQRFQSILSKSSSVLLRCPRSISSVWTSRSVSKGQGQWGQRRPRVLQLLVLDSQPWMTHRRFVGPSGQTMRRRCRACQSRRRQCLLLWLHCQNKHLWTSSKYPQCSSPPASGAPSLSFLQHHSRLATCSLGGHSLWGDVEHAYPTRWSAFSLLCQIVALPQSPADLWVKLLRAAWCNPSVLLPGFASKHRLSFSQCWTLLETLPPSCGMVFSLFSHPFSSSSRVLRQSSESTSGVPLDLVECMMALLFCSEWISRSLAVRVAGWKSGGNADPPPQLPIKSNPSIISWTIPRSG